MVDVKDTVASNVWTISAVHMNVFLFVLDLARDFFFSPLFDTSVDSLSIFLLVCVCVCVCVYCMWQWVSLFEVGILLQLILGSASEGGGCWNSAILLLAEM